MNNDIINTIIFIIGYMVISISLSIVFMYILIKIIYFILRVFNKNLADKFIKYIYNEP